jgi:DNA polymerase (family 10)
MKTSKDMTNLQIAELLRAVAASYKLKDEAKNRFRIVAYERAADAVEHASSELKDLWDDNKLDDIPGIGTSIAEHLDEIFRTGKSKHFEEVMKGLPSGMFEIMEVPGIGAKTGYRLAHELGIKSISDLEKAAKKGHIAKLEGFGEESEKDIIKSIQDIKGRTNRQLLPYASQIASEVVCWLRESKDVVRADPLGSLRRRAATVGDIDIAVATNNPSSVLTHFTKYPKSQRTLEKGDRTSSIVVPGNIQVDLMVENPKAYGALLQHFTGSKHHNIALREYAIKKNLSLSDYGIYLKKGGKKKLKMIATEEEFYKFLGMQWIPPEIRENTGEIDAALKGELPQLIQLEDVKSDLQIHSNFDVETSHDLGESSMEEIIMKAGELKYEYLSFTEHNPSQKGHSDKRIVEILKRKRESIDKINYSIKNQDINSVKYVFNSLEIDIKPDGTIPVNDEGMNTLDFALVSIHSSFNQSRQSMTNRVISALSHPKSKIFAHPTARKINEREGVELDWDKIFDFCLKNKKWIEINCDPMRLDLPDVLVREAVKKGVKMTLGTDAHHKEGLNNMTWGVSVARRGWAEKCDIINTLSLNDFQPLIS